MAKTTVKADWVECEGGLPAWLAVPEDVVNPPGVLLYIEAFGVNDHMRRVAEHFAGAGYATIVPDLYHGKIIEYDNMDAAIAAVKNLDDAQVVDESAQALDTLATHGVGGNPAVIGFCMGGRLAFLAATLLGERLSAAVCYYGGGIAPGENKDRLQRTPPITQVDKLSVPVLLHYGGKDRSITADERARVAAALDAAGKRYTLSLYPEAGHAFNCDDRKNYHAPSATEAWAQTLAFISYHRPA